MVHSCTKALQGLTPLREIVQPPYRPEPGRGRGRPPIPTFDDVVIEPPPLPPLSPIERRAFNYSALEEAMAHLDGVLRRARAVLGQRPIPISQSCRISLADGVYEQEEDSVPSRMRLESADG
jgi:hypothetical protein